MSFEEQSITQKEKLRVTTLTSDAKKTHVMFCDATIHRNAKRWKSQLANADLKADFLHRIAGEEFLETIQPISLAGKTIQVIGYFPQHQTFQEQHPDTIIQDNGPVDIIFSIGQLQWVNDVSEYLKELRGSLLPGGILFCAFPGENSFAELRHTLINADQELLHAIYPRVIPTIFAKDASQLLQEAGFSKVLVSVIPLELYYDNLFQLMADLRHMGGSNPIAEKYPAFLPRNYFETADRLYRKNFSYKGKCSCTVDLIVAIGQK